MIVPRDPSPHHPELTVLALADEVSPVLYDHFTPEDWPRVDLILSSGDLPPWYLDCVATRFGVPLIYVRGNHDCRVEPGGFDGFENAHGRIVTHRCIRIAGFEGCRRYNTGPCQFTEAEMRRQVYWQRVHTIWHGVPDIVLTHAPLAGCHDGDDPCHRGFESFRSLIDAWKPAYFIHGHTHAHYTREMTCKVGETTVVNAYRYRILTVRPRDERPSRTVGRVERSELDRLDRSS